VRFVDVESARLVVVEDVDSSPDVRDAFVKLTPAIPASARAAFDGGAVSRRFRAAGARAVMLAPRVVAETRRPEVERVVAASSPREAVERWFADQPLNDAERAAAVAVVFDLMDAEGL